MIAVVPEWWEEDISRYNVKYSVFSSLSRNIEVIQPLFYLIQRQFHYETLLTESVCENVLSLYFWCSQKTYLLLQPYRQTSGRSNAKKAFKMAKICDKQAPVCSASSHHCLRGFEDSNQFGWKRSFICTESRYIQLLVRYISVALPTCFYFRLVQVKIS